jgi:RND family efflux transporter MFP subunit
MRVQGSGFGIQAGPGTCSIVLLLAFAGCDPAAVAQPQPAAGGALEVVQAGNPTRKTLTLTTTQPARIAALEQTPVHSKLAAYVGEVLVDYGDAVTKDRPLVKLTAPELDAELAQKEALLEQAAAEVVQAGAAKTAAQAATEATRALVAQAAAGTARCQADVERWRSEFTRIEQLAAGGSVNRQLVDETQQKHRAAEASLKEAVSAVDSAKAALVRAQAEAAKADADVTAAQARQRVAQANVAQALAQRSYLVIQAPFAGVVTQRRVDPGHFVQPGAGVAPLLTIARVDKLRAFIAVPEAEAGFVDLGDPVTLEIPSLRGAEVSGKVTRTSLALSEGSRALETIVDLENADGKLRPGLFATAKATLQVQTDVLTLPAAAVVRQNKRAHCFILVDGRAIETPIQLGIKVGDDWEIASGIAEANLVILNKAAALKNGQPVERLKPAPR